MRKGNSVDHEPAASDCCIAFDWAHVEAKLEEASVDCCMVEEGEGNDLRFLDHTGQYALLNRRSCSIVCDEKHELNCILHTVF